MHLNPNDDKDSEDDDKEDHNDDDNDKEDDNDEEDDDDDDNDDANNKYDRSCRESIPPRGSGGAVDCRPTTRRRIGRM